MTGAVEVQLGVMIWEVSVPRVVRRAWTLCGGLIYTLLDQSENRKEMTCLQGMQDGSDAAKDEARWIWDLSGGDLRWR